MGIFISHKFLIVRILLFLTLITIELSFSQNLWAAQSAIVMAERAVIYADAQMSAPVGFVRKGKKILVGEIARNRSQVYPITVSGKIAYIRVIDVSTEKESIDATHLTAERFQSITLDEQKTNYSVSYFNFSSQINTSKDNGGIKNKDALNWSGASIKGGAQISPKWDLDIMLNVMEGKGDIEVFRAVEFGLGGAFRVFDKGRFKARILGQLLGIPFANYAYKSDFRVNGMGFSAGTGLNFAYRFARNFGIEAFGGIYYTKISGLGSPKPYNQIAPTFIGNRLGIGLNYQF